MQVLAAIMFFTKFLLFFYPHYNSFILLQSIPDWKWPGSSIAAFRCCCPAQISKMNCIAKHREPCSSYTLYIIHISSWVEIVTKNLGLRPSEPVDIQHPRTEAHGGRISLEGNGVWRCKNVFFSDETNYVLIAFFYRCTHSSGIFRLAGRGLVRSGLLELKHGS